MQLTIKIKLIPDGDQRQSLINTFEAFNAAANFAARRGFEGKVFSQPSIHKLAYYEIRERYGLTSQLAVRAIGKAVECFKRDKKKCPVFKKWSAVIYDQRIMRFKGLTHVSLASLDGRLTIPIVIAGYQESRLQQAVKTGQADLVYVNRTFYLLLSIKIDDIPPSAAKSALGVDLGVSKVAVDSKGNVFTGDDLDAKRTWFNERRAVLQSVGTKSAKRRLKAMSRKEANYRRTKNHQISRSIVDTAKALSACIKIEDLKGIRKRTRFRKSQRNKMSGWSFHQLREMIAYKAAMAGVLFGVVDPRNTSRTCSKCGHCDKANRKSQAEFECIQCGYSTNADFNAAANIAASPYVNAGKVGTVDAKAGLLLNCG
jgi:IS605 OrfB family transposase